MPRNGNHPSREEVARSQAELAQVELPPPRVDEIAVRAGQAPEAVRKILGVLGRADDVFSRGGSLVRVVDVQTAQAEGLLLAAGAARRDAAQPIIVPLTAHYLRTRLEATLPFVRFRKKRGEEEWEREVVDCPLDLARRVLEDGDFAGVNRLHAIVGAPFLRADGSIRSADGYDAASGVLLRSRGLRVPPIPRQPTRDDAIAARDAILAPFAEFRFAAPAHRAVVVAAVLTLMTRHLAPTAPPFLLSAPVAGSGKTLLADCISEIAYGISPSKRNFPIGDDTELRKLLVSALLVGDPVIAFDNIPAGHSISSAALCAFVTADAMADRILGRSEAPRLPNLSTVLVTGNNIAPRGDLVRRALLVEIDPDTERPEDRTFAIPDLREHVRRQRPALVAAALTLLRAFVVAGAPSHGQAPLASFEAWDAIVRAACVWAGLDDPKATQIDARAMDDDSTSAAALMHALYEAFLPTATFTAADVRARLVRDVPGSPSALGEAVAAACRTGVNGLPYWLREHKGQRRGRYRLTRSGSQHNAVEWSVEVR